MIMDNTSNLPKTLITRPLFPCRITCCLSTEMYQTLYNLKNERGIHIPALIRLFIEEGLVSRNLMEKKEGD